MGATLAATGSAQAADFTVSTLADSGPGSLRQAVLDAEANSGPDRVLFQSGLSGTINLTGGEINISEGLEIVGPGANAITVNGNGGSTNDRIFYASYFPTGDTFRVSGLTLTGGKSDGTYRDPTFDNGGAIYCFDADLALANMVITGNSTTSGGNGGGVSGNQNVTVDSSTISGNTSANDAGGLRLGGTNVVIRNSTISGNHATYFGGGFTTYVESVPKRVENSTIAGNTAGEYGGGASIYSSTGNTERFVFTNTTIASNSATGIGGGILSDGSGSPPILQGTLLANNSAASGPDLDGPADAAFSLIRDTSGATLTETGPNIFGANPQLGSLANNGGPTQTMALGTNSPAIDKGASFGLSSDQRGVIRPIDFPSIPNAAGGDGSDIGAFELQPDNNITLGKLKRNKKKGTAQQLVLVPLPDAGTLTISAKGLKTKTKQVADTGTVKLPVIPKGKTKKQENSTGKATVKAKITYNPTGNAAKTIQRKLKLLKS